MKKIDEIALGFKELKLILFAEKYEEVWQKCAADNKPYHIFMDNMTTAAAIDRLVHHSIILKLNAESYRKEFAKNGNNTNSNN